MPDAPRSILLVEDDTDLCSLMRDYFARQLDTALRNGADKLLLDPGLGFGKSRRQNYEILSGLARLQQFRLPLLVGASRKSFVQAIVRGEGLDPQRATRHGSRYWPMTGGRPGAARRSRDAEGPPAALLSVGDAAAVAAAILGGAHIVRVHDPAAVLPAVRFADALLAAHR